MVLIALMLIMTTHAITDDLLILIFELF